MAEGAWQLADDLKSKIFPKTEGGSVGRNDKVELHRPKTETPSFMQTMFCHRSPDPATSGRGGDHKAGVSDMRSEPLLVGFENVTTKYSLIG
jgi:hypothetical protein